MASTQQLKRRIGSVKNTRQITKAMELVAASKMRRAQAMTLRSREYRNLARALLTRLRELTDVSSHPLFVQRVLKTHMLVMITSDRGLAGAYNSNVIKYVLQELRKDKEAHISTQLVVIGKQGAKLVTRVKDVEVVAVYQDFPDHPNANDIRPILRMIIQAYSHKEVDAVDIVFTNYLSSIQQVTQCERLLPAAFEAIDVSPDLGRATFEPSAEQVLDKVTERLVEAQLNQAFLEAGASEHSMRMLAMKSATDNASELIDDLTLVFNTARQASITQELAEITGGAEAIK